MRFQYTEKKVNPAGERSQVCRKEGHEAGTVLWRPTPTLLSPSALRRTGTTSKLRFTQSNTYFRASESTSDMFASIDAAVATIERQIRKNKTRLARRLRQDAFVRTPDVTSFAPEEPEEGTFEIVRMKKFNMKPMTREEAILQMNLLEHTFFAFRDEDNDGAFAVVYKRTDGGYGLIEDAGLRDQIAIQTDARKGVRLLLRAQAGENTVWRGKIWLQTTKTAGSILCRN